MGQIARQLIFKAPLEKVWGIWTDVENYAKWVDGVQASTIIGVVRTGKGLRWQEKCLFEIGGLLALDHEIREWEDRKRVVIQTDLPMNGQMRRTVQFYPRDQTTEVRIDMEWDLGLAEAIIGAEPLRQMLEKSLDKTSSNWKAQAECP